MVSAQPSILASSVRARFEQLMEVCSLSQQDAAAVARSWPGVLYRNRKTPKALKLDFFQHVIGRPLAALAQALRHTSATRSGIASRLAPTSCGSAASS